jgi:hypothetical protein
LVAKAKNMIEKYFKITKDNLIWNNDASTITCIKVVITIV